MKGLHRPCKAVQDGERSTESLERPQRAYHQSVASEETRPIVVQAKLGHPFVGGWIGTMMLIFMVTVGTVSATLTAFVMYLRPALKVRFTELTRLSICFLDI